MATTVVVTIAGRSYRMACGPGEERRLQALGLHVDEALGKLRGDFGEIGDHRLVIMTAIKITDDLFEAKRRIAELESQLATYEANRTTADIARDEMAAEVADAIDLASDRVERIVRGLRDTNDTVRPLTG